MGKNTRNTSYKRWIYQEHWSSNVVTTVVKTKDAKSTRTSLQGS